MRNEEWFLSEGCRGSVMAGFWTNSEQRAEEDLAPCDKREKGEGRREKGEKAVRVCERGCWRGSGEIWLP